MARVRVLSEILAHKISAGEIVDRPASVVKELLENAIDATSTRISIDIESGGKRIICLRDDGHGMNREDARLAFQHHATSKISSFEDLSSISTLGFRGEALPSIASVSRLRLSTVERGSSPAASTGTKIEYEGGEFQSLREISWPVGTEVTVEDLFFNVPARRKFLKKVSTELGHISRHILHYALAYPEIEFRFKHQQQLVMEATAVSSLKERAYQVLGETFLDNLVPLDYRRNGIYIHGFTCLPHEQRSSSSSQFLYVNRRMVRDRVLAHAIRHAYRDLIPSSKHPVILAFLEIDPEQIDINVHPSKIEVRFRDTNSVHSTLYHAIEEALFKHKTSLTSTACTISENQLLAPGILDIQPGTAGYGKSHLPFGAEAPVASRAVSGQYLQRPAVSLAGAFTSGPAVPSATSGNPHPDCIPETAHLAPTPVAMGQFVESFVVAADREGILLVDQHVAHERILYEEAWQALQSSEACPTQQLLLPVIMELTAHQKAVLEPIVQELSASGFQVEWFGPRTIAITSVPSIATSCDPKLLISEILDGWENRGDGLEVSGAELQRLREKIAISLSCRSAIKVNTPLSKEKIQWLLDTLFRCQNPYTCPHGRPIILRLGIEELLRGFKRI